MLRASPCVRALRKPLAIAAFTGVIVLTACATVDKTATDDQIVAGEQAQFQIVVGATDGPPSCEGGAGTCANDVTLTDDLPDGQLWVVSGDVEPGGPSPEPMCTVYPNPSPSGQQGGSLEGGSNGVLECFWEEVAAASPRVLVLTATTDPAACGDIANVASVNQPSLPPPGPGETPIIRQDTDDATIAVECLATATPSAPATATGTPAETDPGTTRPAASAAPTRSARLANTSVDALTPSGGHLALALSAVLLLGSVVALAGMTVARNARPR